MTSDPTDDSVAEAQEAEAVAELLQNTIASDDPTLTIDDLISQLDLASFLRAHARATRMEPPETPIKGTTTAMTNVSELYANVPAILDRQVRKLRRDLEDITDRHVVTPGLTSEGRATELARIISGAHEAARSLRASIAAEHRRAIAVGDDVPPAPDQTLIDGILAVRTLDDANALVATLK
jgi:hypothetical protein